jgi:hypothetical protein
MEWRCYYSNVRAPALQVQSPESKPQSHQKKLFKREINCYTDQAPAAYAGRDQKDLSSKPAQANSS